MPMVGKKKFPTLKKARKKPKSTARKRAFLLPSWLRLESQKVCLCVVAELLQT